MGFVNFANAERHLRLLEEKLYYRVVFNERLQTGLILP